jgi:hypothetical protein
VILPFDRARLRERNRLDEAEERREVAAMTPSRRVVEGLALSEIARDIGRAANAAWLEADDLEESARLYAAPLRLLAGR